MRPGSRDRPVFELASVRCDLGTQSIPNGAGWSTEIERGCRLAVLGRSGSGKTTFLHVVGLLARPTFGQVSFSPGDGCSISYDELYQGRASVLARVRSAHFGFVFQSDHLLENLSTQQNLALPLLLRGARKSEAGDKARALAERFFAAQEMEADILGRNPSDLSGGQRSRISLLRGLVAEPSVLFLDEPFTYLDNRQTTLATEWLKKWQANAGVASSRTIIFVTHHLEIAAALGTHFLVAKDNRDQELRAAAELGSQEDVLRWLLTVLPPRPEGDG